MENSTITLNLYNFKLNNSFPFYQTLALRATVLIGGKQKNPEQQIHRGFLLEHQKLAMKFGNEILVWKRIENTSIKSRKLKPVFPFEMGDSDPLSPLHLPKMLNKHCDYCLELLARVTRKNTHNSKTKNKAKPSQLGKGVPKILAG